MYFEYLYLVNLPSRNGAAFFQLAQKRQPEVAVLAEHPGSGEGLGACAVNIIFKISKTNIPNFNANKPQCSPKNISGFWYKKEEAETITGQISATVRITKIAKINTSNENHT